MHSIPAFDRSFPFQIWDPNQEVSLDDGPSLDWTLRLFNEHWFVTHRDKKHSAATRLIRLELLAWWERLTDDPPLWRIDEAKIEEFTALLAQATYCRSKSGRGAQRPLSTSTQAKYLRNLRTLLNATGPQRSPTRKTVHLVAAPPLVAVPPEEEGESKQPMRFKVAKAMWAAAAQIQFPKPTARTPGPPGFSAQHWLEAWFSALYYLGFREGTIDLLQWSMVEFRRGKWWVRVPKACVEKTGKGRYKYLHQDLVQALERIRTSDPRLIPFHYSKSWRDDIHRHLQTLAGVPPEDLLSVQAWRRTHANAMESVAHRHFGELIAQMALDHADRKTTRRHYLANEWKLLRKLPRLARRVQTPQTGDRQLELF